MDLIRPPGLLTGVPISGFIEWDLFDEYGRLKEHGENHNLVTVVGDEYWSERAAGIASPPAQVTGMQLGSGTTAPAKTGAGAAIVTLVAASLVALDSGFPTSAAQGTVWRIQWKCTWAAGVATSTSPPIAEVALVNQATATQTVAPASATIARALVTPTVPKAAGDSLAITWNTDIGSP